MNTLLFNHTIYVVAENLHTFQLTVAPSRLRTIRHLRINTSICYPGTANLVSSLAMTTICATGDAHAPSLPV
jgi:hypothetical protein